MKVTRARSLAKTASWRVVGTLDTLVLSYIITGEILIASAIASLEVVTKTVLYYLHERGWNALAWGRING